MSEAQSDPWRWIGLTLLHAIHDRQISEHGGADGIRDLGRIESALARPVNLATYETPDVADLAAAHAFGIVRNHGFVDGNKRTAWIAARLFLADHGYRLAFEPLDAIRMMDRLAAGKTDEKEMAAWFRDRMSQKTSTNEDGGS